MEDNIFQVKGIGLPSRLAFQTQYTSNSSHELEIINSNQVFKYI